MSDIYRLGSKHKTVKEIQSLINTWWSLVPELKETGVFDGATETKVKEFQKLQELVADGTVGEITLALLRNQTIKIQVTPDPPVSLQPTNQWVCWANALHSFLQATKDVMANFTPNEWITNMQGKNLTGQNDGLTPAGWASISQTLNLRGREYSDLKPAQKGAFHPREKFGANTLFSAIKEVGYLLMVYNISATLSHTVVVYGMQLDPRGPNYVLVMDPWKDGLITRPFSMFTSIKNIAIMARPGSKFTTSTSLPFRLPSSVAANAAAAAAGNNY